MKNTYVIILAFIAIFFFQCKDDTFEEEDDNVVVEEKISGNASFDTDGDDIGDLPMQSVEVYFGDSLVIADGPMGADWGEVLITTTDDVGNYEFNGVMPVEGKAVMLAPIDAVVWLEGIDITPDGDPGETEVSDRIDIAIQENEHDDGNNFVARQHGLCDITPKVSPYWAEMFGTDLCEEESWPLYVVVSAGMPALTSDGYLFEWINHTTGQTGSEDTFPNVMLSDSVTLVMTTIADGCTFEFVFYEECITCTATPYIEPYWDFCTSYDVCEMETMPLIVKIDEDTHALLVDGYLFSWNNLTTGETESSNVIYIAKEDSIELTITFPDGCIYEINYFVDCPD